MMYFFAKPFLYSAHDKREFIPSWISAPVHHPQPRERCKAYEEFDEAGRMKPSSYCDWIVDVMKELVRCSVRLRPDANQFIVRYSERKESNEPVVTPVEKSWIASA